MTRRPKARWRAAFPAAVVSLAAVAVVQGSGIAMVCAAVLAAPAIAALFAQVRLSDDNLIRTYLAGLPEGSVDLNRLTAVRMERREVFRLLPVVLEMTDDTGHILTIQPWFWTDLTGLLRHSAAAPFVLQKAADPTTARRLHTLLGRHWAG